MDLEAKRKGLPSSPGVYLMKDSLGNIIYVGKSKNLKSRVGSYFQNSKSHSPKVVKLVKNLKDFEYILTDTEFEAFILECKLIKEIKPAYNRLMKTPMSYSYIKVTSYGKYPSMETSSECSEGDGNICFGPYTSRNTVERALQSIKEHCKILCSNNSRKTSACLNYSLGLCIGMCLDSPPIEQYFSIVDKIIALLNGTDKSILEEMESIMNQAAERFDFETAAKYRDYISAVNYLLDKINVVEFAKENKNIALLEFLDDNTVKFFLIKGNKVLFSEKYKLADFDSEELKDIFKANILFHFNNKDLKNLTEVKREDIDEAQIIYSYLESKSNNCKHVIIEEEWLRDINIIAIDTEINKLLRA